jgi:hypothetical protein
VKSAFSEVDLASYLIVVQSKDGRILSRFDFSKLNIDLSISLVLANAMRALFGHTTLETQRQVWRCIRKFVFCNESIGFICNNRVPEDALFRFKEWLGKEKLSGSTRQSQLNVVVAVLTWCSRNYPDAVSKTSDKY